MTNKKITGIGALTGMIAILLGAFGAHALKKMLSAEELTTFETGVKYQMYHALFLLFLGATSFLSENTKKLLLKLVVLGVILFSGSIYLLATKKVTGMDISAFGVLTPIGGALLIAAWGLLFWNIWSDKR